MKHRYKKLLLFLEVLAIMSMLLVGCSSQPAEDPGELIQRPAKQLEMYI